MYLLRAYSHLNIVVYWVERMLRIAVRSSCNRWQYKSQVRCSSTWNWSKSSATTGSSSSSSSSGDDGFMSVGTERMKEDSLAEGVLKKCQELHGSIMPVNERLRGPLAQHSDKGTSLPFVLLVGNHSSGKSSFINHVLGKDVQTAGVAPTDDCFTVICPGPENSDRDGPALIGDPDMGFAPLRQFGPTLIHHSLLKIRKDLSSNTFMMIDTPGMIDSAPGSTDWDRGYDFTNVVKWLAERADVVCLFFDPDKPGTTGETLRVLTNALTGMDHKLLIVLNKADQFQRMHDFARAYGSLCWNLSKVIPRKDLPRIYTMCLPNNNDTDDTNNNKDNLLIEGLNQTREDVVAEVKKAPKRRLDNVITHLHDSVHLLLMHARVIQEVQSNYSKAKWSHRIQELSFFTAGMGSSSLATIYLSIPAEYTGGMVGMTILGVGGLHWFHTRQLEELKTVLTSPQELDNAFQRTHNRQMDEYTASVWQRIKDTVQLSLLQQQDMPSISQNADIQPLLEILEKDIPSLRRQASPNHFGSSK